MDTETIVNELSKRSNELERYKKIESKPINEQ